MYKNSKTLCRVRIYYINISTTDPLTFSIMTGKGDHYLPLARKAIAVGAYYDHLAPFSRLKSSEQLSSSR